MVLMVEFVSWMQVLSHHREVRSLIYFGIKSEQTNFGLFISEE